MSGYGRPYSVGQGNAYQGEAIPGDKPTPPVSSVESALMRVVTVTEDISLVVQHLTGRLAPVLAHPLPQGESGQKLQAADSPLEQALNEHGDRLTGVLCALKDVSDRVRV